MINKVKDFDYIFKKYNYSCLLCSNKDVRIYHINNDQNDNTEDNLVVLCENCYKKVQNGLSATVYKTFVIEIAHHLPGHPTCGVIHGHSMHITVGITGPINLKTGMVIDFKILKKYIQELVINKFDHTYLNDIFVLPTAEIFAYYIFLQLKQKDLNVSVVRVYETENNYAEITLKDMEK